MSADEFPMRDLQDLAEVVRRRRREENLTFDQAADRFGVGRRLLVELEGGKRNVRARTLIDLVNLLGYDIVLRRRGRAAQESTIRP